MRCSHVESLNAKTCSQPATYRLRRHNAKTKAPWRYLCAEHLAYLKSKNASRDKLVVQKVEE